MTPWPQLELKNHLIESKNVAKENRLKNLLFKGKTSI